MSATEMFYANHIIRDHVLRRYEDQAHQGESWRDLPEIPNKSEIMPHEEHKANKDFFESWDDYQKDPVYNSDLPKNIVNGPWPSKEEYIGAHYQLLREDAVAGLRNAVTAYKRKPGMSDDQFTHVYTHVSLMGVLQVRQVLTVMQIHFKGLMLSHMGPAFRIEFSHERAGKQIRWEQSTRLQQGTIVALSPMTDSFQSICKIAIVAARPISGGLDRNPPEIDIFWGDVEDAVFDPVECKFRSPFSFGLFFLSASFF
jgi:helicase required for RNAi-mediated heterochromatin assembly 1